jgi:hypothetical protein
LASSWGETLLAIKRYIFTTLVCQIAQRLEAKTNDLLVERIQFAQGGNANDSAVKKFNFSLKGTTSWNELAERSRYLRIANF